MQFLTRVEHHLKNRAIKGRAMEITASFSSLISVESREMIRTAFPRIENCEKTCSRIDRFNVASFWKSVTRRNFCVDTNELRLWLSCSIIVEREKEKKKRKKCLKYRDGLEYLQFLNFASKFMKIWNYFSLSFSLKSIYFVNN